MNHFFSILTLVVFWAQLVVGKDACLRSDGSDAKCPALVQGTAAGPYVIIILVVLRGA